MKKSVLLLFVFANILIISGCNSMSKETRVIATQGIRLVPVDYEVIGDTAAEDSRTFVLGIDFEHLFFSNKIAAYIDEGIDNGFFSRLFSSNEETVKRGAMYKALEKLPHADRIIEPRWTIDVNSMIVVKKISVKLTAKAISYKKSAPGVQ
jgi:hypothetical protein